MRYIDTCMWKVKKIHRRSKNQRTYRVKKKKMGSFLDKPITTKFTEFRETKDFVWVVASMQGWRAEMEDAHVCISEECGESEHHFFGVFDGHGGKNAAKLSAKGLYDKVKDNFKTDSTEDPLYEAKKCGVAVRGVNTIYRKRILSAHTVLSPPNLTTTTHTHTHKSIN